MSSCYLLIIFATTFVFGASPDFDVNSYSDRFNCYERTERNDWYCCGFNALGESHCAVQEEWELYEGKYRHCRSDEPSTLAGTDWDLCCDSEYVNDCGKCKSFYVWNIANQEDMESVSTLSTDWRQDYLDQNLSKQQGYDNQVFPAGFQKGTLREFNDPAVCVFIPHSAAKVIEVKVEADKGDRICIGDVHDETVDRNNPGQNDACGTANVKTCFGDANVEAVNVVAGGEETTQKPTEHGFAFYLFCDEECTEGGGSGDVSLWFRARFSKTSWLTGTYKASENVEMWCDYVIRDYPEYDVYPSDLSLTVDAIWTEEDDSVQNLFATLFLVLLVLFY